MTPDIDPPPPEEEFSATVVPFPGDDRIELDDINSSLDSTGRLLEDEERRRVLTGSEAPLRWNDLTMAITQDGKPIELKTFTTSLRRSAERHYKIRTKKVNKKGKPVYAPLILGRENVADTIVQVAQLSRYNPVTEYLASLKPVDGAIDQVARAMGLTKDLDRTMLRKWACSAVARALNPGCKVDTVLVLVGEQGVGKSSFFDALGGDFFSDTAMDMKNKDRFQQLHAAWIYEWSELSSIRVADMEDVKAFVTSREDNFRAPYAAETAFHKRAGIIVGSTNRRDFLRDPTGSRRFWPIEVSQMDIGAVVALRDAFWGEAMAIKEPWWFEEAPIELTERHEEHRETDAWESTACGWAKATTEPITVKRALTEKACIGIEIGKVGKADQMRMAAVFKAIGLARCGRHIVDGVREVVWQFGEGVARCGGES